MSDAAGSLSDGQADSLVGLLNQLAEVPDPAAVSMMPQTAGWAVLAGLFVVALLVWAWRRWQHWQANAYRRDALAALDAARDAAEISAILKRTALMAYGRRRVAALSGEAWLAFLDKTGAASKQNFRQGPGRVLATAAYRAEPIAVGAELTELARRWVLRHPKAELAGGGDV